MKYRLNFNWKFTFLCTYSHLYAHGVYISNVKLIMLKKPIPLVPMVSFAGNQIALTLLSIRMKYKMHSLSSIV